ncbi:MAG: ribonuclease III [Anaerolineae bacterium]|nr:ribonuclease III [Anaerolineae bacterium]
MDNLASLEDKLGFQFQNRSVLMRALTHRSYLNENPDMSLEDNERLEFLGDAVLDFLVGAYLYHRFPEMDEGELTSLRAALVRANTLADFARGWDLGAALQVGFGESESGGRERIPILCATFEAVIGAVYLDQGLERVKALMNPMIEPALKKIMAEQLHKDAKSEFQVWAQARFGITPHYEVVSTSGPDHAKVFKVSVMVGQKAWGTGEGRSKQTAAQAAARKAMIRAEDVEDEEE